VGKRVLQVLLEEGELADVLELAQEEERSASAMGRVLILEAKDARSRE
jgi:hypothetical protein